MLTAFLEWVAWRTDVGGSQRGRESRAPSLLTARYRMAFALILKPLDKSEGQIEMLQRARARAAQRGAPQSVE
jgi:hypothetical protein